MSNWKTESAPDLTPEHLDGVRAIARTLSIESFEASLRLCSGRHARGRDQRPFSSLLDLQYGPADRNLLDVYMSAETENPRQPLILFVHGGGFTGGNRRVPDTYLYANVAAWANAQGASAALMSYRLAPMAGWPSGAEDVATAIEWLERNALQLGVADRSILVVGHSAGATHVASWLSGHAGDNRSSLPAVRGVILISGIYEPALLPFPGAVSYFGEDLTPKRFSSLAGLASTSMPVLLVAAELDPPAFKEQWEMAVAARSKCGSRIADASLLPGQNHFTSIHHLGGESDALGVEMARFAKKVMNTRDNA